MLWRVYCLLLSLLWILYRMLCRGINCLLCGLYTELSTFKVKATLANTNTTTPATSLCCLCCIYNCLSHFYLCKCSLSLLGSNLYSLATSYFCPPGGLSFPSLGAPPAFLQRTILTNYCTERHWKVTDDELTLMRLGLNLYP
jgi:hypothetical protein